MKYLEKAFNKFGNARKASFQAAVIVTGIPLILSAILQLIGVSNSPLITIVVQIFFIPLSFGFYKFILRASLSNGEDINRDYLFEYYQEGGLKVLLTSLCKFFLALIPAVIFVVMATFALSSSTIDLDALILIADKIELTTADLALVGEVMSELNIAILVTAIISIYLAIKTVFINFAVVDHRHELYYFKAIGRSFSLTKKRFFKIFGFGFVIVLLGFVLGIIMAIPTALFMGSTFGNLIVLFVQVVVVSYISIIFTYGVAVIYEEAVIEKPIETQNYDMY